MLPKKLVPQSMSRPKADTGGDLLSQVIVQSILITALDGSLHAAIGPKPLHGRKTFHREWIIRPNVLGNKNDCFEPLQIVCQLAGWDDRTP